MFYSQLLLSKKEPLGVVWLAAHCHRRLKKDEIHQTNISASVDKILDDEVRMVTHRILAFLLLGVVRIYSKKVEYLFHDCQEVLEKLCGLKIGKSPRSGSVVSRTHYHSIKLPKRFELDAFDLELVEDQDLEGGNVRSRKQAMRADGQRKGGATQGKLVKENVAFSEARSTPYTPPGDILSPSSKLNVSAPSPSEDHGDPMMSDEAEEEEEATHDKPSHEVLGTKIQEHTNDMEYDHHDKRHLLQSPEILRGTRFSLDDRLDPMVLDEVENEQINGTPSDHNPKTIFQEQSHGPEFDSVATRNPHISDSVASSGTLQISGFSLEERTPGLKMSGEAEKGLDHEKPSDEGDGGDEEPSRIELNFQEDETHVTTGLVDKAQPVVSNKMKKMEVITPESREDQKTGEHPVTIVAPEFKIPETGLGTPEVATITTPAPRERVKTPKKRKPVMLDQTTMVPHKIYKSWLEDSSDLRRKKRKVHHSVLQAWRAHKLGNIPRSFLEPLISGASVDFHSLELKKSYVVVAEPVPSSASQDGNISLVRQTVSEQTPAVGSPVKPMSPDQTPIAPGTLVTHLDSLRSHEVGVMANSDIVEREPTSSFETVQKQPSEGLEFDAALQEEMTSVEGNSPEKGTYSARTRVIGKYLRKQFVDKKKKKEEEVLNLSELLTGKTKKESARLFYEMLVLKTQDCIDVQQDNAYDDILLRGTPKLEQDL